MQPQEVFPLHGIAAPDSDEEGEAGPQRERRPVHRYANEDDGPQPVREWRSARQQEEEDEPQGVTDQRPGRREP